MATIRDVAQLAGVSVATVSRVINHSPKASERSKSAVFKAMAALQFYPNANAKALAQQSTANIGLVVGDVSDPFFGSIVKSIDKVACQTGHFLLTGNGYHNADKEQQAIEQMIRHRCAAIIVHAKKMADQQLIPLMQQINGMVLLNRLLPGFEHRCIALDNHLGAYLATQHLIQQGHQQIACICSTHLISDTEDRLRGYRDALQQYSLPCPEALIVCNEPDGPGGEQAMIALLERGRNFSAIVCYNDSMAAGALAVLSDHHIAVPGEISVTGFDDGLVARYVRPRLTTVRYPVTIMAEQAAELALALAKGHSLPQVTNLFTPCLIRRHSVAPPDH